VSTFGGHGYDALMILTKGDPDGGTDREKVRSAIENLKGFVERPDLHRPPRTTTASTLMPSPC